MSHEEKLREALDELDEAEKVILHNRYWENMEISEIASFLNMSQKKVNKILSQTLKELRKTLSEDPEYFSSQKVA